MAQSLVVCADIVKLLQLADDLFPFICCHQNLLAFLVLIDNVFWVRYHVITRAIIADML